MTSALRLDDVVAVPTRLFGTLTISSAEQLHFQGGIPGFPGAEQFILLSTPAPALHWLQAVDAPELAFLVVEYGRVATETASWTGQAYAIVTLPSTTRTATVNLRAPVLIDDIARAGVQMILTDSTHGTAEELDLDLLMQERHPLRS